MIHECPVCHDTVETRDDVDPKFVVFCDGPTGNPKSHEKAQMHRRGFPPPEPSKTAATYECPVCHDTEADDEPDPTLTIFCTGHRDGTKHGRIAMVPRDELRPEAPTRSTVTLECPVCHKRSEHTMPREGDLPLVCRGEEEKPHPSAHLMLASEIKPETTTRPAHYGGEANPFEPIKIIEAMGWGEAFCLGNAVKYLLRADKKGGTEDLAKAEWYIRRVIDNRTREKK